MRGAGRGGAGPGGGGGSVWSCACCMLHACTRCRMRAAQGSTLTGRAPSGRTTCKGGGGCPRMLAGKNGAGRIGRPPQCRLPAPAPPLARWEAPWGTAGLRRGSNTGRRSSRKGSLSHTGSCLMLPAHGVQQLVAPACCTSAHPTATSTERSRTCKLWRVAPPIDVWNLRGGEALQGWTVIAGGGCTTAGTRQKLGGGGGSRAKGSCSSILSCSPRTRPLPRCL